MSDRLDRLINSSAQDLMGKGSTMYMSLKTAILDHDQKELLKKKKEAIDKELLKKFCKKEAIDKELLKKFCN